MMARKHMMQRWTSSVCTTREFLRAFLCWRELNLQVRDVGLQLYCPSTHMCLYVSTTSLSMLSYSVKCPVKWWMQWLCVLGLLIKIFNILISILQITGKIPDTPNLSNNRSNISSVAQTSLTAV